MLHNREDDPPGGPFRWIPLNFLKKNRGNIWFLVKVFLTLQGITNWRK